MTADNIVYYEFKELQYTVQEGGTYQVTVVQTSKDDIPWFFTTHHHSADTSRNRRCI